MQNRLASKGQSCTTPCCPGGKTKRIGDATRARRILEIPISIRRSSIHLIILPGHGAPVAVVRRKSQVPPARVSCAGHTQGPQPRDRRRGLSSQHLYNVSFRLVAPMIGDHPPALRFRPALVFLHAACRYTVAA
jgi:hypothetical protein